MTAEADANNITNRLSLLISSDNFGMIKWDVFIYWTGDLHEMYSIDIVPYDGVIFLVSI